MNAATTMLTASEAAVVSCVKLQTVNYMIDRKILPDAFVSRDGGRRISADACVYISFFEGTANRLTSDERKRTINSAIGSKGAWRLSKAAHAPTKPWVIWDDALGVDLTSFANSAAERYRLLEAARDVVVSDPLILGGEPVIKGTRVPAYMIAGFLTAGDTLDEILESYPSLTAEHVKLAAIYAEANPQMGRPKTIRERFPEIEVTETRVYPRPSRAK